MSKKKRYARQTYLEQRILEKKISSVISTAIVCLTLYAFFALAHFSYGKYEPYDIEGLNKLSTHAMTHRQAQQMVELWGSHD